LHAVHALQAGKDVYVEKPLCTSIREGRTVIEAATKYGRVIQFGTWQRTMEHYRKAAEIVRSGRLGQISEVKVWDYDNFYPGFGSPVDCDPPKELDWEMYLGPAPKAPYNPNRYRMPHWFFFFDYGGGWEADWGVHHYDIVHWAMDAKSPVAATAMGGNLAFPNANTDWPDTFNGVLHYPSCPVAKNGFLLQYTFRGGCRREQRSHGKWFFGTDGALLVTRGGYWLTSEIRVERDAPEGDVIADAMFWLAGKGRQTKAIDEHTLVSKEDAGRHLEVFIEHVRNRTRPTAEGVEAGHYATIPGHLMNIAWRLRRQIRWDGKKEEIPGDPEANALLSRPYRAPWRLEA
jgi:predicted dehydrogenase